MRIVYNLRDQDWQRTKSLGILNVSTRILAGLSETPGIERIDVLANSSLQSELAALRASPVCRFHFADAAPPRQWMRLLWDQWSLSVVCDRLAPDWLLLPKGFCPLFRWPRARVSALVHDNVLGYYRNRGMQPFPTGEATLFRLMLRQATRRADLIVTNSNFTTTEISAAYAPRCAVARIGAPVDETKPPSQGLSAERALLVPTSTWPHKLTQQAIAWIERWFDKNGFSGRVHGYGSLTKNSRWPARERWVHHGRASDDVVRKLHTADSVLVYFSDYEGYGLPPVEAAAAGLRAIASDLPPLRETMPSACLFDNQSYASFDRVLNDALVAPPRPPLLVERPRDVAARWVDELRRCSGQKLTSTRQPALA